MDPNIKLTQQEIHLLWKALNDDQSHLKSLNQKERGIVKLALKNMNIMPDKASPNIIENNPGKAVNDILNHLKIIPKKSGFLKRIAKGIGNFFHLRISSADLQSKISKKQEEFSKDQVNNAPIEMAEEIGKQNEQQSILSANQTKILEFTDQKEKLSERVAELQKKHDELINVRSQINDADKERIDVEKKAKEWELKAGDEKDRFKKAEYQQESWKCKATSTNLFNNMTALKSNEGTLLSDYNQETSRITKEFNNLKSATKGLKSEMESLLTDNPDQEQLIQEKNNLEILLNTLTEESTRYGKQINENVEEWTRIKNSAKELLFG